MGLKHRDLIDTVLSKVSIDEFEPQTGKSKDVAVVGFYVTENSAGQDLYTFINSSHYNVRDVEVSPNPTDNNYYMVFVEMDRKEGMLENIRDLIKDIENVTGNLRWKVSTHLTDEYYELSGDELSQFVIEDPNEYMTRDEFDAILDSAQQDEQENEALQEEERHAFILNFFENSLLSDIKLSESKLTLRAGKQTAQFDLVGFGEGMSIKESFDITESAVVTRDYDLRRLNSMLGKVTAVKINEFVVFTAPNNDNLIVTRLCGIY